MLIVGLSSKIHLNFCLFKPQRIFSLTEFHDSLAQQAFSSFCFGYKTNRVQNVSKFLKFVFFRPILYSQPLLMEPLFAFLSYFLILLIIGWVSSHKMSTDGDYLMGNRGVNFYVTALSAHSSDMSAWLFMGLPGAVFLGGIGKAWIAIGLIIGMWCNWQFIAPRLRRETEKWDCYTLSSFFEKRFSDTTGALRLFSGVLALLFLTAYLTAGVVAMGYLIESLFGIDYLFGTLIIMPVLITYVLIGGYVTVAWIDFFQGLFLFAVVISVPVLAYVLIGGWESIAYAASLQGIPLSFWEDPKNMWCDILFGFGWGLGYLGQPHILTKFMGIKQPDELVKSKWIGMSWQTLALTGSVLIGLVGIGFFPEGLQDEQLVFVQMVQQMFLPFMASFVICAVIAANMSTMDSQVLVAGSVVSEDLFRTEKSQALSLLRLSRVGVVVVSLLATCLGLTFRDEGILVIVNYAWSGLGATFGPLVVAALYTKRINKYGAMVGIVCGGTTAALWPLVGPWLLNSFCLMPIIPGFLISWLCMEVVSKWTKN